MAKQEQLQHSTLMQYLKGLPTDTLDAVYNRPAISLAVYQQLPELARQYVMRLMFVQNPVRQSAISTWSLSASSHAEAVKTLQQLHIFTEYQASTPTASWKLNATFKENLSISCFGGGKSWYQHPAEPDPKSAKDEQFLNKYSRERWECILHYMVGSQKEGISVDTNQLLIQSGLMAEGKNGSLPTITTLGFQFLLLDLSSQGWFFLLSYLDTCENMGIPLLDALSLLFQISFLQFGKEYSSEDLNPAQEKLLQHLREFGFVYQRSRKASRFYPTQLAINLVHGLSEVSVEQDPSSGFLVVETNFRVYAYTDSKLELALLALFCEMISRFPNMFVAVITRDSVRNALNYGIRAEQIVRYLQTNAHPEEKKTKPYIPQTVTDQIHIWELEKNRFKFEDAICYSQFLSDADFRLLADYAKSLGATLWQNSKTKTILVKPECGDAIKTFWKQNKKGAKS